ncbi:hypothetical protein NFI96_032913 [Prochilodus magdalenae]|nr:hypothetical protein NFI96_032913 [Prochilodus magdalenae]
MNRWILQMGFPVVTIDTQTGSITQNHFLLDPDKMLNKPSVYKFPGSGLIVVPFTAVHDLMKTDTDWVLANLGVSGFYRVNYDSQNWQRLLSQLSSDHSVIPEINRAQTIDDAFNLARAKIISLTLALSTTKYLSEEREYMPWEAAINNLNYFFLMFDRTEVYGALQKYLRGKVQPLFNYFRDVTANWTQIPAGHTEQYNQINAISLGCRTGVEGCTDLTKMWYRQWMENPDQNPIHPNLRSAVYCDAIAAGGVEEWEFAWKMYKNSGSASETEKLLYVLSCTKNPWLLNRYLEYTLDPTMLRKQDATSAILHVANSVHGHRLAWHFIRENWDQFISEYGGFLSFTTILLGVSKRFSSAFELMELYLLQRELLSAGHTHAGFVVHHAAELANANVKWMAENKQEVMMWLRKETA